MKILFLDDSSIIKYGIGSALEKCGIEVRLINVTKAFADGDNEYLERNILGFNPDAIFNEGVSAINYSNYIFELIDKYKIPYIYWAIDDPVEMMGYSLPHAKKAKLLLTTAVESIPIYKKIGINAELLMFGVNKDFHKKGSYNKKFDHDIIFIGNNYSWYKARRYGNNTILKPLINRNYDVKVFGNEWWFSFKEEFLLPEKFYGGMSSYEELPDAYATAKIVLGLHSVGNSSTMMSMRTFEVLGCGAFYLSQYVPALEVAFKKGIHLEWSRNSNETLKLVEYYLSHELERKEIAIQGQKECYLNHEYKEKAEDLIKKLKLRGIWR